MSITRVSNDEIWIDLKTKLEAAYLLIKDELKFEPKDEIYRRTLTATVNGWLYQESLKIEALTLDWMVQCNEINNTPEQIAAGEVHTDFVFEIRAPFQAVATRYRLHLPKKE